MPYIRTPIIAVAATLILSACADRPAPVVTERAPPAHASAESVLPGYTCQPGTERETYRCRRGVTREARERTTALPATSCASCGPAS